MSKVRKLLPNIYKGNCSEKVKCKCDKLSSKSCFNQFAVLCTISQENASGGAVIYFDPLEFFNWNHRYTSRRNCDSSYAICDLIWLTIINKFLNKNPECKTKCVRRILMHVSWIWYRHSFIQTIRKDCQQTIIIK